MTKKFGAAVGLIVVACAVCVLQFGRAQDKAATQGTLKAKVHYKGSGTVDDKHKILVFLFDSPEFVHGGAMPFAVMGTSSKDGTVTFSEVAKSPVYVSAVYDPKGAYEGQMGPPPAGVSLGMYSKTPGEPAPVKVEAGKNATVEFTFDDTVKMQ